METEIQSKT